MDKNIYDLSSVAIGAKAPVFGTSFSEYIPETTLNATLSAGSYTYAVAPVFSFVTQDGVQGFSEGIMTEVSVDVISPNNSVLLAWNAIPKAVSYNLYRTNTRSWVSSFIQNLKVLSFLDIGYLTSLGYPQATQVKFSGSVSPAGSYLVQLNFVNWQGNVSPLTSMTSNPDGTFQFNLSVPKGTNGYQVVVSGVNSAIVRCNAYDMYLLFETVCQELLNITQEIINQDRADSHLAGTLDLFTGNIRYPDNAALLEVWAEMTDVFEPTGYTPIQFSELIQLALEAYRMATTYQAILALFTGLENTSNQNNIVFFGAAGDAGSMGFPLGKNFKFYVVRSGASPSLEYSFNGGNIWFRNQRGYMNSGTYTLPSTSGIGTTYFAVYIDGTRDSNGYFELKTVRGTPSLTPDTVDPVFTGLPINSKVLGVFLVNMATQDIIQIAGMGRLGAFASSYIGPGTGPFWCGPSFITCSARVQSAKYKACRLLIFWQDIFGSGYLTDTQYSEKITMIKNLLKTVKSQGTIIFFGATGSTGPQIYQEI